MIFAGFLGDDSIVTPSQETRNPFTRPAQATANYVPRSLDTGFKPEFEPFPMVMNPQMPRLPQGIRNPLAAEPQAGGVPTAGDALPADPSGQSSIPSSVPSPVKMRGGRMMPPHMLMALGIMPGIRGVRSGRNNPAALVASGRNPGTM